MCGIAGVFCGAGLGDESAAAVKAMTACLAHRGPDDEGLFTHTRCVLGHRRLSIIDLSPAGHQPFLSDDGRYALAYNGEIYNYVELRETLVGLGWRFRTRTDTEVLLKCLLQYGLSGLDRLNGMFALALYDTEKQELLLARDRIGIKPLYTLHHEGCVWFASELKAFRAVPRLALSEDRQALFDYLVFNRTDVWEETFFNEVRRLPHGHHLVLNAETQGAPRAWWSVDAIAPVPVDGEPDSDVIERVRALLASSVHLRMRSDVPVGSCLSGGLDSTILLGLLHEQASGRLDDYATFTATFPGYAQDESAYVDGVQQAFGVRSHRITPTAEAALSEAASFVAAQDEPTGTPAFYSQYAVMRLAREEGVTVLLDGQGGDEIFAGYPYLAGFFLRGLACRGAWASLVANALHLIRRGLGGQALPLFLYGALPRGLQQALVVRRVPWLSREVQAHCVEQSCIQQKLLGARDLNTCLRQHFQHKLEHLLRSEDRNSMAFSLEARVPYLDHRLVEYVLSLPAAWKIRNGEMKWLQKAALGRYTTPAILARRDKIGFNTPAAAWMGTPPWHALAAESFAALRSASPELFAPRASLPSDPVQRWKLVQLHLWRRQWQM